MDDKDLYIPITGIVTRNTEIDKLHLDADLTEVAVADQDRNAIIDGDALGRLIKHHRKWRHVPADVPLPLVFSLWFVMVPDAGMLTWLIRVLNGSVLCAGQLCHVATLFGHPVLAFVMSGWSLAILLVTACATRGLTSATFPVLILMCLAGSVAAASMAGVIVDLVFLVLVTILVVMLAGAVLVAIASR